MNLLNADRRFLLFLVGAVGVHNILLLIVALAIGAEAAASEVGPLEIFQEIVLGVAALLFFAAAWLLRHAPRMAAIDAGLLCIVFFFRELEISATGPITSYLNSGTFRWHEVVVVLALLTPYAILRWRLVLELIYYVLTLRAWPFFIVVLFLALSWGFDKYGGIYVGYPAYVLLEEIAESNAYFVLMIIALLFVRKARLPTR